MDFVHDALADGRPFRILTVVDQWSRSSPLLEVASRMSGHTVGEALDRALEDTERPRSITVDHGSEFQSRALEDWSYRCGVQLDFIRPSKPVENAFIESFKRAAPRRMSERARVRVDRRRTGQDRSVAYQLQSAPATRLARSPDADRVRRPTSGHDHRRSGAGLVTGCLVSGPTSGPGKSTVELSTRRGSLRDGVGVGALRATNLRVPASSAEGRGDSVSQTVSLEQPRCPTTFS